MRIRALSLGLAVLLAGAAEARDLAQKVAVVNGETLTLGDIEESRHLLPPQFQAMPLEPIYGLLLNSLIDRRLTVAKARDEGLDKDPEVRRQMARVEEQILQRAYFSRVIEASSSESVLRELYQAFAKDESKRIEVKARHILVGTEDEAKAVLAALKDGADFVKLAREKSGGASGDEGGELGYFRYEQMPPEFAEVAFKLKPGQIAPAPVRTQLGWHVIKLEDRRIGAPPSFEESRDRLRADVARKVGGETIDRLRRDAKIERFTLDGSPMTAEDKGK